MSIFGCPHNPQSLKVAGARMGRPDVTHRAREKRQELGKTNKVKRNENETHKTYDRLCR